MGNHPSERSAPDNDDIEGLSTPRGGALAAKGLIVVLNFSDWDADVWIPFPFAGTWTEQIDGTKPTVHTSPNDQWASVTVPSNYGGIYLRQ